MENMKKNNMKKGKLPGYSLNFFLPIKELFYSIIMRIKFS